MSASEWIIPAHGRVEGGSMDGYSYAFLRLERRPDGELDVWARVTPPNWPFPKEAHLFVSEPELLRRLPGARVPRIDLMTHAKRILCAHDICAVHGGGYMYVPKDLEFELGKRDLEIYERFNGTNLHELVVEYKVTHTRIYQIVAQVRARELRKRQPGLPGMDEEAP